MSNCDKQIIIDGVDVSRCIYYKATGKYNTCGYDCELTHNCYYKNWQRKEQECEELKKECAWVKESCTLNEGINYDIWYNQKLELDQLEVERDFLSNQSKTLIDALLYIKELAEQKLEWCKDNKKNCTNCEYTCKENMILEKINEVIPE